MSGPSKLADLQVFGGALTHEVKRFIEHTRALPDVFRVAVMPDVHLAGDACVGTVVGTRRTLRPYLLGSDLGCGVAALPLGVSAELLDEPDVARVVLAALAMRVPRLAHPGTRARPTEALLEEPLSHLRLERARDRDGVREHGTIGRGNHFVELQEDEEGMLHVMAHTGSRAMGPLIQQHHLDGGRPRDVVFDADSARGRAYLHDVDWAVRYAASSRRSIALEVASIIAGVIGREHAEVQRGPEALMDCHHDAVVYEAHAGEWLWVHRKGAVPAPSGADVLVPGSMGTWSYHCRGRGEEGSMRSSAHGAGRSLPRGEARRQISVGRLCEEIEGVLLDTRRLFELRDEAPSAYKDIEQVMRAQRKLVKQVRRLRPRLVHK